MMLSVLTFVCSIGCGVVGGVLFAFSTFVMPALARLPGPQGMAAMQSINITAITPAFMLAIFGTGAGCAYLAVVSALDLSEPNAMARLIGSVLYVAGNVVVTMICNVPRNNALAAADPNSPDGARLWQDYLVTWTRWNHVRTLTAIAGAALLGWAT
jgi:uncharacterized membrane protein